MAISVLRLLDETVAAAMKRFTVLLPVLRPPAMLPYAIESVLAQSMPDFELFVICDGAPPATIACAEEYAARDPRVNCRAFPKGERNGEAHRHTVLMQAGGDHVAQISDDDLWLPNHLEELGRLLQTVDFGHTQVVGVHHDGHFDTNRADLSVAAFRERLLARVKTNRFGPTFAGYRMDAYRRLPEGWAPAPEGIASDLHMWRKFLGSGDIAVGSRMVVTALHFAAVVRGHMSLDERAEEIRRWSERIRTPHGCADIVEQAWRSLAHQAVRDENFILALEAYAPGDAPPATTSAGSKLARLIWDRDEARAEAGRLSAELEAARREIARLSDALSGREK